MFIFRGRIAIAPTKFMTLFDWFASALRWLDLITIIVEVLSPLETRIGIYPSVVMLSFDKAESPLTFNAVLEASRMLVGAQRVRALSIFHHLWLFICKTLN